MSGTQLAALESRELGRVLRSTSMLPRARAVLLLWKMEGEAIDVSLKLTMAVAEKLAAAATRARNAYCRPKQLINSLPGACVVCVLCVALCCVVCIVCCAVLCLYVLCVCVLCASM